MTLEEAIAIVRQNAARRRGDVPMVGELLVAEIDRLRATRPATDEEVARVLGHALVSFTHVEGTLGWVREYVLPRAMDEMRRLGLSIVANSTPEQPT